MIDIIYIYCVIAYLIHMGIGLNCYGNLSGVAKLGFAISFISSPLSLFVMTGFIIAEKSG